MYGFSDIVTLLDSSPGTALHLQNTWFYSAKTQKIEPDTIFFLTDESFGGSVQTWLTQREVVFI